MGEKCVEDSVCLDDFSMVRELGVGLVLCLCSWLVVGMRYPTPPGGDVLLPHCHVVGYMPLSDVPGGERSQPSFCCIKSVLA